MTKPTTLSTPLSRGGLHTAAARDTDDRDAATTASGADSPFAEVLDHETHHESTRAHAGTEGDVRRHSRDRDQATDADATVSAGVQIAPISLATLDGPTAPRSLQTSASNALTNDERRLDGSTVSTVQVAGADASVAGASDSPDPTGHDTTHLAAVELADAAPDAGTIPARGTALDPSLDNASAAAMLALDGPTGTRSWPAEMGGRRDPPMSTASRTSVSEQTEGAGRELQMDAVSALASRPAAHRSAGTTIDTPSRSIVGPMSLATLRVESNASPDAGLALSESGDAGPSLTASFAALNAPLRAALSKLIASGDGTYSVAVSLNPPELGHVQATIKLDGASTTVTISTSTDEGHLALAGHLSELQQELEAGGSNVQLSLSQSGDDRPRQERQQRQRTSAFTDDDAVVARSIEVSTPTDGLLHVVM